MSWRDIPEQIPDNQITTHYETDLAIVGLGYAGIAAMRAARECGAAVIGIEKMTEEKYRSFGRDIGHVNSHFLESRDVPKVDPIELFNEWMRRAGGRANPDLVMQFCKNSGAAFDWFTDMYGIEGLKDLHVAFWPNGGENYKKAVEEAKEGLHGYHFWTGTAQFPDPMGWKGSPTLPQCAKANIDKAVSHGASVLFNYEAMQLIKIDDRVCGVIIRHRITQEYASVKAKKVILATGDFSGDAEMVEDLCCDITDLLKSGEQIPHNFGRDGSGHKMGVWAGGRLESRPLPTMGGNQLTIRVPCSFAPIILNRDGKRFCNEAFGGTEIGNFVGNQIPQGNLYVLFDEHYIENELSWATPSHGGFDANTPGALDGLQMLFERAKDSSVTKVDVQLPPPIPDVVTVYTGSSPENLVKNAGIDDNLAQQIINSILRYNQMCKNQRDEDYGRDAKLLDPLTDKLFLLIVKPEPMGHMLVTVGGFVTDSHQQVLDENYERIEGLYATGNCCGRRFGPQYSSPIPGVSIGMAITLGREVGMHAALETD